MDEFSKRRAATSTLGPVAGGGGGEGAFFAPDAVTRRNAAQTDRGRPEQSARRRKQKGNENARFPPSRREKFENALNDKKPIKRGTTYGHFSRQTRLHGTPRYRDATYGPCYGGDDLARHRRRGIWTVIETRHDQCFITPRTHIM